MVNDTTETEQLHFMGHDEVGTDPSRAPMPGDQQENGNKGKKTTMGARGDNEESPSKGGSVDTLDMEDLSLESRSVGNEAMSLTPEQRGLLEYFEEDG